MGIARGDRCVVVMAFCRMWKLPEDQAKKYELRVPYRQDNAKDHPSFSEGKRRAVTPASYSWLLLSHQLD